MRHAVLLVLLATVACASDFHESPFDTFGAAERGSEGEESAESSDHGLVHELQQDDSGGAADDGADPIKFDVLEPDAGPLGKASCGVDILFVIDNSGSMGLHKQDIVDAFDNFIAEMITTLDFGTLVHIGITRATGFFDPGNGSGWGDPACSFGFLDGVWNPPTLDNNGVNGQQGRLFEHHDKRYYELLIGDDTDMAEQWFEGALYEAIAIEQASNTETVIAGATYPFHPINADYNAGFVRPQAVLVLFLISDAPDATPNMVSTHDMIQLVIDAKSDCGETCVLPTGIVQALCYDQPGNVNTRLFDFMNAFGGPPPAIDFFYAGQAPQSFTSVLGATLAETIAHTCEIIVG